MASYIFDRSKEALGFAGPYLVERGGVTKEIILPELVKDRAELLLQKIEIRTPLEIIR